MVCFRPSRHGTHTYLKQRPKCALPNKSQDLMATGCPVLYKPFNLDDLLSVLLLSAAD